MTTDTTPTETVNPTPAGTGMMTRLRTAFSQAVQNYKNGPQVLVRSFGMAAIPGVMNGALALGDTHAGLVFLANVAVSILGSAVGAGTSGAYVSGLLGAIAMGIVPKYDEIVFATVGAGAVAGAVTGVVGMKAVACADHYSVGRRVTGIAAGVVFSGMMAFNAASHAPKKPEVIPSPTLNINATGECTGVNVGESVELKNGKQLVTLTIPAGCPGVHVH